MHNSLLTSTSTSSHFSLFDQRYFLRILTSSLLAESRGVCGFCPNQNPLCRTAKPFHRAPPFTPDLRVHYIFTAELAP